VALERTFGGRTLEDDAARARTWMTAAGTGAGPAPNNAQYLVLVVSADLTDERVFTAGDGLDGTDGGAGGTYTLDVDVTDFIDTAYGLTEDTNNIRINAGDGLAFDTGALVVDLVAAWSGLEFSGGDLRVDEDAAFTWTVKHTFTATPAIEIDVASGDPVIVFDTGGADLFVLGVDETDLKFKIDSGGTLADISDLELSSAGNLEIGGDFKLRSGKGLIYATSVAAGKVPLANGTRYVPGDVTVSIITDLAYAAPGLTLGTSNVEGAAETVIRTDATVLVFDATVPNTIQCDDAAAAGAAGVAARRDHEHGIVCAAPGTNLSVSTSNAEGSSTSFARADHAHGITTSSNPGAAAAILATAADGGVQLLRLGIGTDPDTNNAIKVADDAWIGLGAAAGRMVLDSTAAPDEIHFEDCVVSVGITGGTAEFNVAETANSCQINVLTYSDTLTDYSYIRLVHSHSDTLGTTAATQNTELLGGVVFYGVNTDPVENVGAIIRADQEGAVGGDLVPTRLRLFTCSATAAMTGITIDSAGRFGVNIATGLAAQCHIDQAVDDAEIPVLILDQADVSEGTIDFIASARGAIAGATNSAESVRVELNGVVYRLALYADA